MNHKWKRLVGKPIKGEIDRKQCTNCKMEVRRIRHGSTKPRGGWIETHYRMGNRGPWSNTASRGDYKLPACMACRDCPHCEGTGLVTLAEYRRLVDAECGS